MMPRGGDDRVYTPPELARQIVRHFRPEGTILEPCRGRGAFTDCLPRHTRWMEIDEGHDFLLHDPPCPHFDWIVTNPPWSKFRPFLRRSMEVANNIVFLALLNAWFMKARMRDMRDAEFGLVEILLVDTPPAPWPQTGFQLAAVKISHGYSGTVKFSRIE